MDYMVRNPLKLNLGHLGHVEMQCPKQQTTRTPHYPLLNVFRIRFFLSRNLFESRFREEKSHKVL